MFTKEQAIVLRATDHKEKDKLVSLFCLEQGLIKAVLKGVKAEKAKLKFAAMPFCFGEFELQTGKAYPIISGVSLIESFYAVTQDISAYYAGCAVLKVIENVSSFGERGQGLFLLVLKSLKAIAEFAEKKHDERVLRLIKLKFVLELGKLIGFGLDFGKCGECSKLTHDEVYFDLTNGTAICSRCENGSFLKVPTKLVALVLLIEKSDFVVLSQIKCNDAELITIEKIVYSSFEHKTSYRFDS